MRFFPHRFLAVGGLLLLAPLCVAILAVPNYFRANAATITVTNTNDSGPGSLRQTIVAAHDGDIIGFDPSLNGQTITLTTAELVIDKSITISGPGPDLLRVSRDQQAANFRILHIIGHTVAVSGLRISNGHLQSANGGGIFSDLSNLTLTDCTISGNVVNSDSDPQAGGGGIYNDGNLTLVGCTVSDNSATGARITAGGGIFNAGNLTIYQSSINNNSCDINGGGIYSSWMLTIRDSTVNGNRAGSGLAQGIGLGGGIFNRGMLTIRNCAISANSATGGDTVSGNGGGICNSEGMQIFQSIVSGNTAHTYGGGISSVGPFIMSDCTVTNNLADVGGGGISGAGVGDGTISHSTISNNVSGSGGGIYGSPGVTNSVIDGNTAQFDGGGFYGGGSLTNSSVSNNQAHQNGGGIYATATFTPSSQPITVANSTIASNVATQDGGGIYGKPTITNSTISTNRVEQRYGGGLYGGGAITHSTITGNHGGQGGDAITVFGSLTLSHTILTSDTALGTISNNGGTVTSLGYNLSSDKAGGFLNAIGDQTNTDPVLGPLQDNSGPTLTHLLLKGSPAIDTGDPNFTPPPSTDQRGLERVYNGHGPIDIGSVEVQPIPTPTPTPTPGPATHFAVVAPDHVFRGQRFDFSVTAQDQFNNTVTDYAGTVHFTTTSTGSYDLPVDSTLTNGIDVFTAVLGDDGYQTITATDTQVSSSTGTSNPIYVIPESGGSPTPSPTPTPTPAQPLNLSTRMLVQTGDNVGIGGFIISGSSQKHVILRGIGPSLAGQGVVNPLPDPVLELHGPSGFVTITNDNWTDTTPPLRCGKEYGLSPTNDLESCIEVTLDPAPYTAILRDKNSGVGVGLVEIYDVGAGTPSKLANISTRGFVATGGDIMIAGFILGGDTGEDNVILRGIGPSLSAFGVPNALADPTLELRNSNGSLIRANNDWQDDPAQAAIISAAGLAPTNTLESGIAETLSPGQYTALLAGPNNGTGVGLVEMYDLLAGGVATHFSVVAPSGVIQYAPFDFSVTALDQFNNIATGYAGTVHFTSSSTGVGTHLPADSMLTTGTGMFSANLEQPGNQTITATDTANGSITGTSNPIIVFPEGPSPTPTATPPSPTPTPGAP